MKSMNEITRKLEELKPLLEDRFRVKKIGIFGSYTRGEQRGNSDLDVLVEFSVTIGLFEFIRLEDFLRKELGVEVDLVLEKSLKPSIKKRVLEEAIYL